jgi:MFS family permease
MSPFLAGFVYDHYGIKLIFALSIIFLIPIAINLALHFDFHEPQIFHHKYNFHKSLMKMWKRIDLRSVFFLSLIINIFYTAMVIYTPLYLTSVVGLSWTSIGIIFTIMLLPYAIIQFPAGWMADKFHHDKAMLIIGLIITSLSTLAISLYSAPSIYIWMIILFMTRFGAALADAMIEAYFFRQAKSMDQEIINFYRNAPTLGYIVGPIILSTVVFFAGLSAVFPALAIILLCGILFTFRLRANV